MNVPCSLPKGAIIFYQEGGGASVYGGAKFLRLSEGGAIFFQGIKRGDKIFSGV